MALYQPAHRGGVGPRGGSFHGFVLGLITGAVYFGGTLYWLSDVLVTYGGLPRLASVPVTAGLVAYLALFIALFAIISTQLSASIGRNGLLLTPFVWVASELARTHVFGGFPWVLLGYSQTEVLPIAQAASLFGVYGVSALVACVNAALAGALMWRDRRARPVLAAAALVATTAVWGQARLARATLVREGESLRVGLIQGNVPQDQKWNPDRADEILRRYLRLSRDAAREGARFIIWPESATPFYLEEDPSTAAVIRELARDTSTPLLVGSDQIERGTETRYYNAAFLIGPDGTTQAVYRKMHLVPFGEYVPLKRLLFFAAPLVESVSDFSPGDRPVLLPVGDRRVSVAICYEIVYPELIRQFVSEGSELLTAITNDAWYGRSSAPFQHFSQASMRAIEQGRYLVRAANTGISGIVDPYGHQMARSGMFEPAVIVGDVRLLSGLTVYARIGDLFAYLSVAMTVAALLVGGVTRRG